MAQPVVGTRLRVSKNAFRVLLCGLIIFNANPLVKNSITYLLKKLHTPLSKKKNSINYVSLFSVLFNSFYFIYPTSETKFLESGLLMLWYFITKVQMFELIKYIKEINATKAMMVNYRLVKSLGKSLMVSIMLVLKSSMFFKTFKGILLKIKIYSNNKISNNMVMTLAGLGLSLTNANILKTVGNIVGIVNLFEVLDNYKIIKQYGNKSFKLLIAFLINILLSFKQFGINYPAFLVDYSIRCITDEVYYLILPISKLQSTNPVNVKNYKKFQSFFMALIMINLIKYCKGFEDQGEVKTFDNFAIPKYLYKLMMMINNGVIPYNMKKNENDEEEKEEECSTTEESKEKKEPPKTKRESVKTRSAISRRHSTPATFDGLKVYDNDYSLHISEDSV